MVIRKTKQGLEIHAFIDELKELRSFVQDSVAAFEDKDKAIEWKNAFCDVSSGGHDKSIVLYIHQSKEHMTH